MLMRDAIMGVALKVVDLKYTLNEEPIHVDQPICADIETYGAVRRAPVQTVFHPAKSEQVDRVHPSRMIKTVSVTTQSGQTTVYQWKDKKARRVLYRWFTETPFIINQNLIFDLLYLRYCDAQIKAILDKRYLAGDLRLWDLSITNYLHNEIRPERSLKALSTLFGYAGYEKTAAHRCFQDEDDGDLHRYNAEDTVKVWAIHRYLCEKIRERYGDDSAKMSDYCHQWYSDLIWTVLFMSEGGVKMHRGALEQLYKDKKKERSECDLYSLQNYAGPLHGTGSSLFIRRKVWEVAANIPRWAQTHLERTKTRRDISTSDYNLQLLSLHATGDDDLEFLRLVQRYRAADKLVGTYLRPLLEGTGAKRMLRGDMVYPTWFIVPSTWSDEADDKGGGTNQARLSCKRPALQTLPEVIKKCLTSRFEGGEVWGADLSQIELRIAALLSNDQVMMDDYLHSRDRHIETAKLVFAETAPTREQRQVGKTGNFLTLYRGGADKYAMMLFKDAGIRMYYSELEEILDAYWQKHEGLRKWQDELIAEATDRGFLELPLIGQSRLFLGNERAVSGEVPTICNLPVQALAADVFISAQGSITRAFRTRRLRSMVVLCVHDAIYTDVHPEERGTVRRILDKFLPNSKFFRDLCEHLGRTIPLDYEIEPVVH
jgi:DNA polymerase I-like protein with 3'-5' exonuclease and polymerase domains